MAKRKTEDHSLAEFFAKFMIWGSFTYIGFIIVAVIALKLHLL